MAAKSRMHAHHENHVEMLGGGAARDPAAVSGLIAIDARAPNLMDLVADGGQIRADLGMNGDRIGACLDECADVLARIFDHQVRVERQLRDFADRLHHRDADRQIGHEMAVHHVEMDRVGAGCFDLANFVAESSEVSGENRGG